MFSEVICCDWGTSSFRVYLVNVNTGELKGSVSSREGIAKVNRAILEANPSPSPEQRETYFLEKLKAPIDRLSTEVKEDLTSVPVIISGMASSSIGMRSLPYADLPFPLKGHQVQSKYIPADKNFDNPIYLISGVCSENDVMRGEETQLIGLATNDFFTDENILCILPGTHSKHIAIENGNMADFQTFMTGELFNILIGHSILKNDVDPSPEVAENDAREVFQSGVRHAFQSNIIHDLFTVRTNRLFEKYSPSENFYYLSGLLVGAELKGMRGTTPIYLCAGSGLFTYYKWGLHAIEWQREVVLIPPENVDQAAIYGQLTIYQNLKNDG